jgi:hypothetical protein
MLPKLVITLFFVWWIYSYLNEAGWLYSWTSGSYGMKSAVQIQHDADAKLKAELEATKSGTAAAAAPPSAATATNAVPAK